MWNYCTLSKAALVLFAFDLYDQDNSGAIDVSEIELMLKEIYGKEFCVSTHAQNIMRELHGGELGDKDVNIEQFREFCRHHPACLYPAFMLQQTLQNMILGSRFWGTCGDKRVALSNGEYMTMTHLLEAHVNEQAFKELCETKDKNTGVAVQPLAESDAAPILQASGTLANRRQLQEAVNENMTQIKVLAAFQQGAEKAKEVKKTKKGGQVSWGKVQRRVVAKDMTTAPATPSAPSASSTTKSKVAAAPGGKRVQRVDNSQPKRANSTRLSTNLSSLLWPRVQLPSQSL
ncbi:unnamed protein product [Chrysoparadoxa australica]